MLSSKFCKSLILAALLLACGCTPFQRHDRSLGQTGLHVVNGVPFHVQQSLDDCGPAALASLLAHRGKELPLETITRAVSIKELGGSLLPDLENFARLQGFATRSGRGDPGLLRRQIDAGRPVLITVEMGFLLATRPHYLVVFGYDEKGFIVHTGVEGSVFIDEQGLLSRWGKMNSLYLYLE